jgi:ABC-type transport system substrate-binding protein
MMKKTLAILLALVMVLGLVVACAKPATEQPKTEEAPKAEAAAPAAEEKKEEAPAAAPETKAEEPETKAEEPEATAEPEPETPWDGAYLDKEDYKAYTKNDLDVVIAAIEDQLEDDTYAAVKAAKEAADAAIDEADTLAEVRAAYEAGFKAIAEAIPLADGLYTFKKESNAERTNVLGILERFAVTTGITGISLFENGGYVMYNPRVTLGTENYIVGYGFGILAEGAITADLEYETNEAWKRYYHISEAEDPGTLNYYNDQGSQVGDLFGYQAASFYTNFMNETKDGYDWVPELAKEKPVAVNDEDGDGMATTWRFEVRTGADGLKYTTGSEMEDRAAFNNREVALEDYVTPFKMLLTQSNALYRGSELANTKSGAFAGAKEYYNGTAEGPNDELWANVGLKAYEENGKNYFEVTFTEEQTQFYCMYYIASSLYMPLPQEFIDLVTVQNIFGYNNDKTQTPMDNAITVGPYYVERYDQDQQIVYKKNPNYVYADTKYAIEGIHDKIFTASREDTSAVLNEFLAGHFDASGIPQEYLSEYRNDPRTRSTTGNSNFKLNVNATNAETWEYLFGEEGVVTQTPKDSYWELKPALGNHHFVQALSYSIDRLTFANARGSIPSVDYLASNYMSDPENGLSYATTEAHKKAVETLLEDTDGYGYSLELARDYFRMALTELEADGAYTPGTKENPTVIHIEIAWMYPTHEENYHNEIKNFMETAFNDESVCGGVYQLSVDFWVGNAWSDVYYNKMMVGQFDIGFGSISGNSLDPIGFVSVLSSDQDISGSFTLNWGVDTNDPEVYPIVYKNMRWSFDGLYNSVNSKGIVSAGKNEPIAKFNYTPIVKNDDGSYTGSMEITTTLPDLTTITPTKVACCEYERYYNGDGEYAETEVEFTTEDKGNGVIVVTFTVPADVAADYATGSGTSEAPTGYTGFDFYYDQVFDGAASSGLYYSVGEDHFEVPAAE